MKTLAEVTKPKEGERIAQAGKFITKLKGDSKQTMTDWQIDINEKPQILACKQLDPGCMEMQGGRKKINVLTANLDRDTQTTMFEQPPLDMWAIVYGERDEKVFQSLMRTF